MTELTFLIELLLNHDLPKATKDLIAQRIKEVEEYYTKPIAHAVSRIPIPEPTSVPMEAVGHTAAAAAALAARQTAIQAAVSGIQSNLYKAKPKPAPGL